MRNNNILWAIVLIIAVAMAIWSGWWAIAVMAKIIIYVVLALVAIGAIVMMVQALQSNRTKTGEKPLLH